MKNLLLWLALSSFFVSCNYYSVYEKKQAENFEKSGIKEYEKIFDGPDIMNLGTYIEFKTIYMTSPVMFDSKKKTLLLIHGYQGGAIAQWSPNVEELSKYFNIPLSSIRLLFLTCFDSFHTVECITRYQSFLFMTS